MPLRALLLAGLAQHEAELRTTGCCASAGSHLASATFGACMAVASLSVLYKNAAGQLIADPAEFIRMTWSSAPRTLADTQELLAQLAHALRQRNWSKVLANQTVMASFSPAEQQWIAQEWLPQAVQQSGYRYGAIVVSTDTYARLATAFITTNVQGLPVRYRSFDDAAQAAAWLLKMA